MNDFASDLFKQDDIRNSEEFCKYYALDNYKIVDNFYDTTGHNICLICFSGNNVYYPNNVETAENILIKSNRYEWENITSDKIVKKKYARIIYVRDVWKNWYVKGINQEYDSVDKVADLLRNLTAKYDVHTVGTSSGGYAAILFGYLLNASMIYDFSGQFVLNQNSVWWNDFIEYWGKVSDYKYYDLVRIIESKDIPIFYFYPAKCSEDIVEYQRIKDFSNIYSLGFDNSHHAVTMTGYNYKYVLTMEKEKLISLMKKCEGGLVNRVNFFYKSANIFEATMGLLLFAWHKIKYGEGLGIK